jgi:hypothetical protein
MAEPVRVNLERMGVWQDGGDVREVARVLVEQRPAGPAESSLVELRDSGNGAVRGRYLAWIGYGDLDEALELHPDKMRLVEPPEPREVLVEWHPFGNGDGQPSLSGTTGR